MTMRRNLFEVFGTIYALPLEWNNLDENRYISNRTTFKTALKYNLLSSLMDGTAAH